MEAGRGRDMPGSDVSVERGEIHLPQLLNEEANADEFSNWEQVSSVAAERFTLNCPPCQGHFLKWGSLFFLLFCLYPVLRYPVFYHYGIL